MAKGDRSAIQLDDGDNGRLHAIWSRSGKHLIVTVTTQRWDKLMQIELRPDQVEELVAFLSETIALEPTER